MAKRTKKGTLAALGALGKPFSALSKDQRTVARSIERNDHKAFQRASAKRRNPKKYQTL